MMAKNQRGSLVGEHGDKDGFSDRFPVGMRVLAVDDDQTCLKVLEKMLMQCRYHGSLILLMMLVILNYCMFSWLCSSHV